jgi:hypothetical protein
MGFCPHARGDDSFDTTFAVLDPVIGAAFLHNRVNPAAMRRAYA